MLYRRAARAILVVLFLCAMVCAQGASLAFEHPHSSGHCCRLCHLGPLPFLQAPPVATVAPVTALAWFQALPDSRPVHEILLTSASSRAPPSSSQA